MKKSIVNLVTLLLSLVALPFSSYSQITTPTPNTNYYIIHSSGNVVGENTADGGRAVLQAYSGTSQRLQFVPDGTGYYSIKIAGQNKYLSLSGSWNTYFLASATVDEAKFSIEPISSIFVTFKCKANGKYLGTDNIATGTSIFSDKSGTDSKHYWFISEQFTTPEMDSRKYSLNPNAVYDLPFEGWGVSLCWWANMCGEWNYSNIDEIVDWLVSKDGLNYNIFRYNIGGGDDPQNRNCTPHHMANGKGIRAEMDGFKDGTNSGYNWARDNAQRTIMLKIRQKRPDAIFEAFSNSAPYYMTYRGCCAGNTDASKDNLKPAYYKEFAQYLIDVCKHYRDNYGIVFKTLDPFNEPVTNYWGANGGQEGCHFSTASQKEFLKVLSPMLTNSGLKTVIAAADETSVAQQVLDLADYAASNIHIMINQVNTHTYTADNLSRAKLRSQCTFYKKTLWMSEVGQGGTGISGNLSLAQKLMNDIHYLRPEAWVDWQYIEEGNDQWCLVKGNFANQSYAKVKNYYVRQQCSKYIRKDFRFVFAPNDQMIAALNPTKDSLVVVLLNNSSVKVKHEIDLSQFAEVATSIKATRTTETENNAAFSNFTVTNKTLSVVCNEYSISTLVIPVKTKTISKEIITDVPYMILARSANMAIKRNGTGIEIGNYVHGDSTQIWKFTASGSGYKISDYTGKILTDNGSYFIFAADGSASGQEFSIESIGDDCFKIISASTGKAFDLQSEATTAGTKIGLWSYSLTPDPVTRQWLLYPLPSQEKTITQTITLNKGWNLISINLQPERAIPTLFAGLDVQEIKTMDAYWKKGNQDFLNTLQTIEPGDGYLVNMNVAGTLSVTGVPVETRLIASLQSAGWHLIGCPFQTTTPFSDFFDPNNCETIKNFDGFWMPNGTVNSIQNLEPGKAYFGKLKVEN
ncbi:MAG: RICIN domain-containing protein [Bacteroidales bacterium]|nr:RICIN domain-containing protein [Bacteroidales bacterium]